MNIRTKSLSSVEIITLLALLFMAILVLVVPGSSWGIFCISAIGGFLGLSSTARIAFFCGEINFTRLASIGIGIGYLLPVLTYSVAAGSDALIFGNGGLIAYSYTSLSDAVAITGLVICTLHMASTIEPPIATVSWRAALGSKEAVAFCLAAFAFQTALFLTGNLGFSGVQFDESGRASFLSHVFVNFTPTLAALSAGVFYCSPKRSNAVRILVGAVLLASLVLCVMLSRRHFMYSIFLILIVLGGSGFRIRARSIVSILPVAMLAAAMSYVAFFGFIAMRIAAWSLSPESGTWEIVTEAFRLWSTGDMASVIDYASETTTNRQFTIWYLAATIEAVMHKGPSWGIDVYISFLANIPSALFPQKAEIVPQFIEIATHKFLNFPIFDAPNTLLVSGYFDFGFLGAILYPLGGAVFFRFLYVTTLMLRFPSVISISTSLPLFFSVLSLEKSTAEVFSTPRNTIVLIAFLIPLYGISSLVLRLRLRAVRQRKMMAINLHT